MSKRWTAFQTSGYARQHNGNVYNVQQAFDPDVIDYWRFQGQIKTAAESALHPAGENYRRVRCLLLYWKDDDLGCVKEVNGLQRVFQDRFGFRVEKWAIPGLESEQELHKKMREFVARCHEKKELLIVYYGGHGAPSGEGQLMWCANQKANSPELLWNNIQEDVLMPLEKDVLIILDCCHAASAFRGGVARKDILTASGWEFPADGNIKRKTTYSAYLMRELDRFTEPFTPADLHAKLLTIKTTDPEGSLRYTPNHVGYRARDNHQIVLVPKRHETTGSASGREVAPRVILTVTFRNQPNTDELKIWFDREVPSSLGPVNIEFSPACDPCPTTLTMPLALWTHLPQDLPAYQVTGAIRSGKFERTVSSDIRPEGEEEADGALRLIASAPGRSMQ